MDEQIRKPVPAALVPMFFPGKGINDSVSLNDMTPGFAPEAENVRLFEALTGRGRGGSRPGIDQFIPEKHSGTHEIQHITQIVTVNAANLGWSFDGQDQGFPGVYGGIGFYDDLAVGDFGFPGIGGGGYPPNPNVESRILTMGTRDLTTDVITMSTGTRRTVEWPAGVDPIMVRITNQDGRSGDYLGFEEVTLHTAPSGAVGDGTSETTQFDVDDPPIGVHGLAEFSVFSLVPGTIDYYGTNSVIAGVTFTSRVAHRIRFTPYKLTLVADDTSADVDQPVHITGTLLDYLGNVAAGKTVQLHATGGTGDGTTAVTDGSGQVTFTVTSSDAQTVSYSMTELSESVNNVANVEVEYTAGSISVIQTAKEKNFQPDPVEATFPSPVTAGNLIVVTLCMVDLPNPVGTATPIVVTDSLGNTYIEAASVEYDYAVEIYDPLMLNMGKIFYCISAFSGACTITATMDGGVTSDFGWVVSMVNVEYAGVDAGSPLSDVSTASGANQTVNTGNVPIAMNGDLVVAFFGMGLAGGYPASGPPDFEKFVVAQTNADFANRDSYTIGLNTNSYVVDITDALAGGEAANWTLTPNLFYGNQTTPVVVGWVAIAASFKKA